MTSLSDAASMQPFRIGQGFDVHQLVDGRKCIIGGVNIPHEKGLLGHSDADVLLHAHRSCCRRRRGVPLWPARV